MIKGHTIVELKDVKTGEVEVVAKDNMITNGFNKMFEPACGLGTIQGAGQFVPSNKTLAARANNITIIDKLLGGIFLFEDAREENADNYIPTGNDNIVGRGSSFAYTGEDNMLGSYNVLESGWQEDGSYKKVWDFNESQANGQISSVSLTTDEGGALGFGNKYDGLVPDTTYRYFNKYHYGKAETSSFGSTLLLGIDIPNFSYSYMHWRFVYADARKNKIYFSGTDDLFTYTSAEYFTKSNIISLYAFSFPLTKTSPFLDLAYLNKWEKIDINVPAEIIAQCNPTRNNSVSWNIDEGCIYFILSSNQIIVSGGVLKILKVNMEDFSTEIIRFTNNSGVSMCLAVQTGVQASESYGGKCNAYNGGGVWIKNGYLFFHSGYNNGTAKGDGKIYKINLQNNADISCAKFNGNDFIGGVGASYIFVLGAKEFVGDYAFITRGETSDTTNTTFMLNMKKNIIFNLPGCIYPFVAWKYQSASYSCVPICGGKTNLRLRLSKPYNDSTSLQIVPCALSQTLMTINNLSSPVVKTPDKTMKVTYILSEAPDPEPTV